MKSFWSRESGSWELKAQKDKSQKQVEFLEL